MAPRDPDGVGFVITMLIINLEDRSQESRDHKPKAGEKKYPTAPRALDNTETSRKPITYPMIVKAIGLAINAGSTGTRRVLSANCMTCAVPIVTISAEHRIRMDSRTECMGRLP
jgi:hypothetical protein